MDYEKLYKEALDNLNRIKNESPEWWREHEKTMQEIFPGFFETEDERIKNGLVRLLNCIAMKEYEDTFCITKEEALAWVEKQGEQKPVNRLKTTAGNWYVCDMEVMNENMTTAFHRGEVYYCPKDGYIDVNGALFEVGTLDVFRLATKEEIPQQKQEWSEEDEQMLNHVISDIESLKEHVYCKTLCDEEVDFLKSLKDRVLPQLKQEWGEEDEKLINSVIELIDNGALDRDEKDYLIEKLKSLKDRYTWKPSDEMLEALYRAIPENVMEISEDEMLLDKLYQGLKYGRVLSKAL